MDIYTRIVTITHKTTVNRTFRPSAADCQYIYCTVSVGTHTHTLVFRSVPLIKQLPPLITERERNKAMKCFSGSLSQKQKEEVIHRRRDIKI